MSRLKSLYRRQSGQTLVELAVTMPILTILLLGGAELARLAYTAIEVTNAAKAGAQYGDQNHAYASTDDSGMTIAATADAYGLSGLTLTSYRQYQCSNAPGVLLPVDSNDNPSNLSCQGSQIEEILTVTTTTTFDPLIHLPGLPTSYTLTGTATQMVLE